ncbi:MAG: HNH endonuclease [Proteobacteria bacterium]|jgi:hypothetical protein|nr:HNH endonuclease [Pseudomonadota bacterium]
MKEIPLTQGKVALVDDDDFEWLSQWKWCAIKHWNTFYAMRMSKTVNGKRENIQMHHAIIGKKEGLVTDHINGNGVDNRRENLRHVTHRQNGQNRHHEKTSKYLGVHWHKPLNKWLAQIQINGQKKHLGVFKDEQAAYHAYYNAVTALGETILVNREGTQCQ